MEENNGNNQELFRDETQEINKESIENKNQEVQNEKSTKFETMGQVNTNTNPPKKNGKKAPILILLILILAIVGVLAYYYFSLYTNTQVIYKKIINSSIESLLAESEEITTLKTYAKLDLDLDLELEETEETEKVLDLINKTTLDAKLQMDTAKKQVFFELDSDYDKEELLNAIMLIDAENEKTYAQLNQFFDDVLEIELEDEKYYQTLKDSFEIEETTWLQGITAEKAKSIIKQEFEKIIKEEYCSKEKQTIKLNNKDVNADVYILTITMEQYINELKTVMKNLKGNEEFFGCFEEKEEVEDVLENAIEELDYIVEAEGTLYFKIYRTGLQQETVRFDIEVETEDNEKVTIKVEKQEETYNVEISNLEEIYIEATIKQEDINENDKKLTIDLDIESLGEIKIDLEYGYVAGEAIEQLNVEDAVKIDELTDADMLRLYANLEESKLYEIIEEFAVISDDTKYLENDEYLQTELPNDPNDYVPNEVEENISSGGFFTEGKIFIVFATNNNDVPVDIEIEVEFYDESGTFLGSSTDYLTAVCAEKEIAVEMFGVPNNFSTYKIYIDAQESEETTYFDKIEMTHNDNGENIAVQVKNNSEDTIDYITVAVVYYKEGQIVGISDGIVSEVEKGRAGNFNIYYPYDSDYTDLEFDDYKVFINEAYSYNW